MKKLALAICACAFVAVAAPVFADDSMPATDAISATDTADTAATTTKKMKKAKHHKKRISKKHKKHPKKEVAQQDTTTDTQTN